VQLRTINIGKDYGTSLEILGGVSTSDQVIINPSDSLEDGQQVNVAQAPPNPQQSQPNQSTQQHENSAEQPGGNKK
jgi:hypothetical protein